MNDMFVAKKGLTGLKADKIFNSDDMYLAKNGVDLLKIQSQNQQQTHVIIGISEQSFKKGT